MKKPQDTLLEVEDSDSLPPEGMSSSEVLYADDAVVSVVNLDTLIARLMELREMVGGDKAVYLDRQRLTSPSEARVCRTLGFKGQTYIVLE